MNISSALATQFKLRPEHTENIIKLIDDGNTIPFIARYRKEMTGSCDDQVLREFADRLNYLRNLEKRKEEVIASITEQEKMTPEIEADILKATTLAEVEDIYRPFRPKRRTRATVAKEKGLEPLAQIIMAQDEKDIEAVAAQYISEEKGVLTLEEAIAGAMDIIAEGFSDDPHIRKQLKEIIDQKGLLKTVQAKEEDSVYAQYYDYAEPIKKIPDHRILAINRGEKEDFLKVSIVCPDEECIKAITDEIIVYGSTTEKYLRAAAEDSYSRLIFPSIEREVRSVLTDRAAEQAIRMFGLNLRPLLMAPPIKGKVVLGLDPAYRTGCKVCVVSPTGKVLATSVVYPTPPQNRVEEAKAKLLDWINKYSVDCISIGNGTASKESEIFVAELIKEASRPVTYMVVSEAGASVYSASKLGAEEFPDFDVSLRSAVSIARRMQDPLAELVKIDPKAIGVGQYQHDMPQARLSETLGGVVESCVNSVGADLNTASPSLLSYVAGITPSVAKNIAEHREENGAFTDRKQLLKVKKLGPKAYEQCAGFLRIPNGKNPLDNTAVHPESYEATEKLLEMFGYKGEDIRTADLKTLPQTVEKYGKDKVASAIGIGIPSLNDILTELAKPGRDIRDDLPAPMLRSDIMTMADLKEGMVLKGTVRNVIDFGVFVDIGVHQDGLVHISQVCDRFIKHPSEIVKVGDVVEVTVLSVDEKKKRISLSMKAKKQQA